MGAIVGVPTDEGFYSEDYAEHEYGRDGPEQLEVFAQKVNQELDTDRKARRPQAVHGKAENVAKPAVPAQLAFFLAAVEDLSDADVARAERGVASPTRLFRQAASPFRKSPIRRFAKECI